ncbi:MAG: hypothetical protein RBG13Loki_2634 [Promethearchaeota archaeon CR_4]|nr:MAG: hypothetical protein RBG13Loki_2634 [Candidatus Lokiarchaeota archaeon CR_4]
MCVHHRGVPLCERGGVPYHDDLGLEPSRRIDDWDATFRVADHVSTAYILDVKVPDVEPDVISWFCCLAWFVVHFNGPNFAFKLGGHDHNVLFDLDDSRFNPPDWYDTCALDLVHVLDGDSEGFVNGLLRHLEVVECLDEVWALIPGHLVREFDEILALESRDRDERDCINIVPDHRE